MEQYKDFGLQPQNNTVYVDPEKSRLINSCITFKGSGNILFVENGCDLYNSTITFHNDNSVVYLSKNFYKYYLDLSVFFDGCVYIGKNCYFNGPITISAGEHQNILVGDESLFSSGILLKTMDGHLIFRAKDMQRTNYSKSVLIGDHVWVGMQSLILKGTVIGSGAIIGACSVAANKRIASNTAWAGNPVRKIGDDVFFSKKATHAWTTDQTESFKAPKTEEGRFWNTENKMDMQEIDCQLQKCKNPQDRLTIIKKLLVSNQAKNRFYVGEAKGNSGFSSVDVTDFARSIEGFSRYLQEYEDISFLYVQLPYKETLDGDFFPEGVTCYANQNADILLSSLSATGVNTLDMRPQLSQTPEMLQQYFYNTGHYWNPEGAFVAFQTITQKLQTMFPRENIDMEYTQWEKWERHEIEDWFLCSRGKREGQFFGGTDSLIWYTPRFETNISCSIPRHGELHYGDFVSANIRTQYIEQRDLFGYNPYCMYTGGDFPLVQYRNLEAPSGLRVLILKDSFTLPLQSYFSTVFQEVDVIDPRQFTECSIAEHVKWTRPDVVFLAVNPGMFIEGDKYKNYGTEQAIANRTQDGENTVIEQRDIVLVSGTSDFRFATIPLEADSVYKVTFDGVDVSDGSPDGVVLTLYNKTTNDRLSNRLFDLNYYKVKGKYEWIFRTPKTDDTLQLLLYAGIYGSTAGNEVTYRNVVLEKV